MRVVALVAALIGVCIVATAVVVAQHWGGVRGNPFAVVAMLWVDSSPIAKFASLGLTAMALHAIVKCVPNQGSADEIGWFRVMAYAGPVLGLAAMGEGLWTILQVVQRIGPVRFAVMAPTVAEAMLIGGLGFVAGSLSALAASTLQIRLRTT